MISRTLQLEKVKKLDSLLIIHYFHINFLTFKTEDEILKTLSHERYGSNEILKYALYCTEINISKSKWQKMGIMQKI